MKTLVKYRFCPASIDGLKEEVELFAHNYKEAQHKVLKYVYLNKTSQHPPRGVKIDSWGNEITVHINQEHMS